MCGMWCVSGGMAYPIEEAANDTEALKMADKSACNDYYVTARKGFHIELRSWRMGGYWLSRGRGLLRW